MVESGIIDDSYSNDTNYNSKGTSNSGTKSTTKKEKNSTGKTNRPPKMRQKKQRDEDDDNNDNNNNGDYRNVHGSPHDSDGGGQLDSNGTLMKRRRKTELQIQVIKNNLLIITFFLK